MNSNKNLVVTLNKICNRIHYRFFKDSTDTVLLLTY